MSHLSQYMDPPLDVSNEDESGVPLVSPMMSLFETATEQGINYRLFVEAFNPYNPMVHTILNKLLGAQTSDALDVRINSPGGSIDEGVRLFNILDNSFSGRTTTIIESKAFSMGAMLFCKGDQRVVHPLSMLMFHNYSMFAMGKAGELTDQIEHLNRMGHHYFDDIIVNGWLTQDEYKRMLDGKDYWFNAHQMLERGIATHVLIKNQLVSADEYARQQRGETLEGVDPAVLEVLNGLPDGVQMTTEAYLESLEHSGE